MKGMAIGNGLIDPEHMLHYGDYLYQLGLVDANARDYFHLKENEGKTYIKNKDWLKAFEVCKNLLFILCTIGSKRV
jgi:vitellogenic carboxypeptidase-like protein